MSNQKGRISINRPRNGDYICIEIRDESSGVEFVEVRIKYNEYAQLMTGLSGVRCEIITRGLHLVGMIREQKVVEVFVPDGDCATREDRARAATELHEGDGWKGNFRAALNHHNQIANKRAGDGAWYKVDFVRHVAPGGERDEQATSNSRNPNVHS